MEKDKLKENLESIRYKVNSLHYRTYEKLSEYDKEQFTEIAQDLEFLVRDLDRQFSIPSMKIDWGGL